MVPYRPWSKWDVCLALVGSVSGPALGVLAMYLRVTFWSVHQSSGYIPIWL